MQLEQQNFRNANIGPSYMPGVLKNGTTSVEFIIQKLYVPTSLGHPHVFKTEPHIQQNSAEFKCIWRLEVFSLTVLYNLPYICTLRPLGNAAGHRQKSRGWNDT